MIISAPALPRLPASSMRPSTAPGGAVIDHEFGDERHFAETANGGNAIDLGITRIDEGNFALEFRIADVVQNSPANGPLPRTAADQRDRARRKQVLQAIGRHVFAGPAGGGCVDGNSASHQAYGSRIIVRARQLAK